MSPHSDNCRSTHNLMFLVSMEKRKRSLVYFLIATKFSSREMTGMTFHKSMARTSHTMLPAHIEARMSLPCMYLEGREMYKLVEQHKNKMFPF